MHKRKNNILVNARLKLGLIQGEVAKQLNINEGTYSRYESLKTCPSLELQEKIILYFTQKGIDLSEKKIFDENYYINRIDENKRKSFEQLVAHITEKN